MVKLKHRAKRRSKQVGRKTAVNARVRAGRALAKKATKVRARRSPSSRTRIIAASVAAAVQS